MNAGHVDGGSRTVGHAFVGIVQIVQILHNRSIVVRHGSRKMDKAIAQMLTVIHLENEYIMKMMVRTHCKPKKKEEIEKEIIDSFDEIFDKASEGKLCE